MRDYKKLLKAGNAAQIEKLKENGDKPGFENISLGYILRRIEDEYKELEKEYFEDETNWKAVRLEAADIANFAHMLILKCDRELS